MTCKYPLPMPDDLKGYIGSDDFQTKDLDLGLSSYIIDENGQLFIERYEGEWTEGNKDSKSIMEKMGHFKTTKTWLEQLNITTTVAFYNYQQSDKTDYDYTIEYEAVFIGGKISSVKLINFEANENAQRKINDAEYNKKNKEQYKFSKTRRYKYLIKPYNRTISYIFRKAIKGCSSLCYILYKIEVFIKI
jgi:hypothetical protein